ncbi:hypothetical protein LWC34_42085 [Kibdelosporangium philippinense]|uniref:Transposase n=1 Tax=Kibdelosporangium philippinense TaxID=211113 RepID=A0ABS8ZNL1_9PSEU|nr:hypothetical protein [Kibdelosporangium philippinense]MCE7009360.1 hypothetical protein [Kibdelosporangium philippinense]
MGKKKARRRIAADAETVAQAKSGAQVDASGENWAAKEQPAQEQAVREQGARNRAAQDQAARDRAELAALRREYKQLREDNEILQRARAFFARKPQ